MTVEWRVSYSNGEMSIPLPKDGAREQSKEFGGQVIAIFDAASRSELASIQRLAIAAEFGEVDAHQSCGEIAARLGYLLA